MQMQSDRLLGAHCLHSMLLHHVPHPSTMETQTDGAMSNTLHNLHDILQTHTMVSAPAF